MEQHVQAALAGAKSSLERLMSDPAVVSQIARAGVLLADALGAGRSVFSCGNGGSMCDAMHFAEELSGKFRSERAALPAMAISDPAHITCAANDFGYDSVFSRFIAAHGRKGDLLVAISTSGKSPNVLAAAKEAKARGMTVLGLTGRENTALASHSDLCIATVGTGGFTDRIQELHIKVIHILIELVERRLFPENYK